MHTARLTILLPPARKAQIEQKAAAMGISTAELVRRAVDDYDHLTPEQESELSVLIAEANQAIPAMSASLDHMIETMRDTSMHIRQTLDSLGSRA